MSGDGNATILVVDDIPENVRLLDAVLAPRGYDVLTARRQEALDRVATAQPDLILLDVVMCRTATPLQALRADELPCYRDHGHQRRRCREDGRSRRAQTSITKPFSHTELPPALGRCFASSATTTRSGRRQSSFAS